MNDLTAKARIWEAVMELFAHTEVLRKVGIQIYRDTVFEIPRSDPVGITRSRVGPIA